MTTVLNEGNRRKGARGMFAINRPQSPRPCLLISWILTRISPAPKCYQLHLACSGIDKHALTHGGTANDGDKEEVSVCDKRELR